jgi:hypothetical protein
VKLFSRNGFSLDKSLVDPQIFSWTAFRIVLPVSAFRLCQIQSEQAQTQVEIQLHGDLDTYGSFCITVPISQIIQIIERLYASNQDWDARAQSDPQALRNLDVRQLPFF